MKRVVKKYHSEARIALTREITKNHPELVFKLQSSGNSDWVAMLGEIAAHVNIILDGNYMPDELEALYPILLEQLRQKGQIIVVTGNDTVN